MSEPGAPDDGRIVISNDDLDDPPAPAPPPTTSPQPTLGGPALPSLSPSAPRVTVPGGTTAPSFTTPTGTTDVLTTLSKNVIVAGLVAGVLGGVLGMVLAEVLWFNDSASAARIEDYFDSCSSASDFDSCVQSRTRISTAIGIAIFGSALSAVLLAWDGITSRAAPKAARDGLIGAAIGTAAGFVGGYVAEAIYDVMLDDGGADPGSFEARLARIVAWGLFGALIGAGAGVQRGQKKVVNGLIGGVLGGTVGGFLFDQVGLTLETTSAHLLRLVGFALTGAGIGVAIGLVDRLRRDAWISFTGGPMKGKELILFKPVSTLGTDHHCDVVVAKDKTVAAVHATFRRAANGTTTVEPASTGAQVLVNGVTAGQQRLRSGDLLTVGGSTLVFQERATQV